MNLKIMTVIDYNPLNKIGNHEAILTGNKCMNEPKNLRRNNIFILSEYLSTKSLLIKRKRWQTPP